MPDTIRLVDPDGVVRDVDTAGAGAILQDPRWRVATTADELARGAAQAREADYGGVGGALAAGVAGAARGATLGLSDVAARAIGGEDTAFDRGQLRQENPGISFGGELAGAIAPALISGGAALPAGFAGTAGRGVAAAVGGGLRGAIAGGAAEGAIFGAGQGVSELALSQEPLTLERAASTLSSNVLFGAATGGVAGGVARGVEVGLSKAKGALDDYLLRQSEGRAMKAVGELETEAAVEPGAIGTADVGSLDAAGLRQAEQHELEAIEVARQPERQRLVGDLDQFRADLPRTEVYDAAKAAKEVADPEARGAVASLFRSKKLLRDALDVKASLIERPRKALDVLRRQEEALQKLGDWANRVGTESDEAQIQWMRTADVVTRDLQSGAIEGYRWDALTAEGRQNAVKLEVERRLGMPPPKDYGRAPFDLQAIVPSLVERNRALQERIVELTSAPTSERLTQIEAAREALAGRTAAPKTEPAPSLGREVLSAVAPFAGPLGAVATAGTKALGGLRKAAVAAGERAAKAGSQFLDVAGKATGKAAPFAPAVATKVLAGVRYASRDDGPPPRVRQVEESTSTLANLFRQRTDEIKSQVQQAPDGSYQMRPDARLRLASRFDGIRALDPMAADRMETAGARRIEYLASIIPRRPDIGGIPTGPDRWQPSDLAMRAFARSVSAVEDPHAVLERAAAGRVVPEEAAALRAVHPDILDDFTANVMAKLPTLRKTLPYARRLSLSLLTGLPVDAAMTPTVLREIQSMYAAEPGTAGGTQAPTAQPQFGSVKRSDPGTPAQRREGLL